MPTMGSGPPASTFGQHWPFQGGTQTTPLHQGPSTVTDAVESPTHHRGASGTSPPPLPPPPHPSRSTTVAAGGGGRGVPGHSCVSKEGDRQWAGCRAAVWKSWCRNGADFEPPSQLLGKQVIYLMALSMDFLFSRESLGQ